MTRILLRVLSPAALVVVLATAACSSPGSLRADTPTDSALVPNANLTPPDSNIDNRGRGN